VIAATTRLIFADPKTSKLKRILLAESYLLGRVEARAVLCCVSSLAKVDGRVISKVKVSFAEFDALL